jgi:tripartite-type tricarboxylate transporter receptor subunit TctC
MSPLSTRAAATLAVAAMALQTALGFAEPARADEWPSRAVSVVVPYAPGGFTDTLARIASKYLAEKLGQSFVVENRAGAGGGIGTSYVTKSPPDGYILMFGSASQPGIAPLTQKITYDPDALAPITIFGKIPFLLAVGPQYPANDLASFVADARLKRGGLTNAISGVGATTHLLSTGFAYRAGFDIVNIPYKGSAPVAAAVMQGDVEMAWAGVSDILAFVSDKKVKVLAISGPKRSPVLPDVPSVTETYPDFQLETWNGFFAPRGTPDEIVDKIARLMREAVASPEIGGRLRDLGIEPVATTPAEMAAVIKTDKDFYARAVKAAGIKPE